MARFLIDVNLPYYFSLWHGDDYLHLRDIDDTLPDTLVWRLAKERSLTIISKDADFAERAMLEEPPPRVIHIRFGNMRIREFHRKLSGLWPEICDLSERYRLVQVFEDRLEGID